MSKNDEKVEVKRVTSTVIDLPCGSTLRVSCDVFDGKGCVTVDIDGDEYYLGVLAVQAIITALGIAQTEVLEIIKSKAKTKAKTK